MANNRNRIKRAIECILMQWRSDKQQQQQKHIFTIQIRNLIKQNASIHNINAHAQIAFVNSLIYDLSFTLVYNFYWSKNTWHFSFYLHQNIEKWNKQHTNKNTRHMENKLTSFIWLNIWLDRRIKYETAAQWTVKFRTDIQKYKHCE